MTRNDWLRLALATVILVALAMGCASPQGKERVWRNGEWHYKYPQHDPRTDHFGR